MLLYKQVFHKTSIFKVLSQQKRKMLRLINYTKAKLLFYKAKPLLRQKPNHLVFVYDLSVSPVSIGDFTYFSIMARLYQATGISVEIIVLQEKLRDDQKSIEKEEQIERLSSFVDIAEFCIGKNSYRVCSQDEINIVLNSDDMIFPSREAIIRRDPFYKQIFPLFCMLYPYLLESEKEKFIFSHHVFIDNYKRYFKKDIPQHFIAWHIRAGTYDIQRNLSLLEIESYYKNIREQYDNDVQIIIVTDARGVSFCKDFFAEYKNISFSKDYAKSVLGDIILVLMSDLFVQIRGGGINVVRLFSDGPYICLYEERQVAYEALGKKMLKLPWRRVGQIFEFLGKDKYKFPLVKKNNAYL